MAELPPDVVARVGRDFAGETYYEALRRLEPLGFSGPLLRAVVFLARGDLEELGVYARAAERDGERVLFWAEFEDHDAEKPRRVRTMDEPLS